MQESVLRAPRGPERKKLKAVSEAIEAAAFAASQNLSSLPSPGTIDSILAEHTGVEQETAASLPNQDSDTISIEKQNRGVEAPFIATRTLSMPLGVASRMQQLRLLPDVHVAGYASGSERSAPLSPFQSRMIKKMKMQMKEAPGVLPTAKLTE